MGYHRRGQLVDVNIDIAGELPGDGAIVDEMSALVEQARVDDDAFLGWVCFSRRNPRSPLWPRF